MQILLEVFDINFVMILEEVGIFQEGLQLLLLLQVLYVSKYYTQKELGRLHI